MLFLCGTDFGTQTSLFCSPKRYEELYMPYYKQVNDWIHANTNWMTFKHCCGAIRPLMELIKSIKKGEVGKIYEVWSKDAGSIRDIPKWVAKAKHEMVAIIEEDGYTRFAVKKMR